MHRGYQAVMEMRQRITTKVIEKLETKSKIYDYIDDLVLGFVVRVNTVNRDVVGIRSALAKAVEWSILKVMFSIEVLNDILQRALERML